MLIFFIPFLFLDIPWGGCICVAAKVINLSFIFHLLMNAGTAKRAQAFHISGRSGGLRLSEGQGQKRLEGHRLTTTGH